MKPLENPINDTLKIIKSGAVEIISEAELTAKLLENRPLRIKWGADPSAADLHLGHFVILKKLKQLQVLGHEIIFLIGDFTATIGDPSGRRETRKPLSPQQVKTNAETYEKQIFKVLDKKKTRVVFNSQWLAPLALKDTIKLAASYTVARMLERNDFKERYQKQQDINIVEFLYPLLQGYDSVELKADLEIGGTDQKFNLLVGRALQKNYGQVPQVILTMPILEGTDGTQKMSKSLGNYIAINDDPDNMFGKLMSIPDDLMPGYYELLTDLTFEPKTHPMEAKKLLARTITATFWGQEAAVKAQEKFVSTFSKKQVPEDLPWEPFPLGSGILFIMTDTVWQEQYNFKLTNSLSDARRLIGQGAVEYKKESEEKFTRITAPKFSFTEKGTYILKVGKGKIVRLVIELKEIILDPNGITGRT